MVVFVLRSSDCVLQLRERLFHDDAVFMNARSVNANAIWVWLSEIRIALFRGLYWWIFLKKIIFLKSKFSEVPRRVVQWWSTFFLKVSETRQVFVNQIRGFQLSSTTDSIVLWSKHRPKVIYWSVPGRDFPL